MRRLIGVDVVGVVRVVLHDRGSGMVRAWAGMTRVVRVVGAGCLVRGVGLIALVEVVGLSLVRVVREVQNVSLVSLGRAWLVWCGWCGWSGLQGHDYSGCVDTCARSGLDPSLGR